MRGFAEMSHLDVWYASADASQIDAARLRAEAAIQRAAQDPSQPHGTGYAAEQLSPEAP